MTRITPTLASLLTIAALATGCASAPALSHPPTASTPPDCRQLSAEIARTEEVRRDARAQEKEAWKGVVPFAVAARYARGRSAAEKADRRLDQLHARFSRQGCTRQPI